MYQRFSQFVKEQENNAPWNLFSGARSENRTQLRFAQNPEGPL